MPCQVIEYSRALSRDSSSLHEIERKHRQPVQKARYRAQTTVDCKTVWLILTLTSNAAVQRCEPAVRLGSPCLFSPHLVFISQPKLPSQATVEINHARSQLVKVLGRQLPKSLIVVPRHCLSICRRLSLARPPPNANSKLARSDHLLQAPTAQVVI